ncbi:MAG: HAD-IA family hydrolase [Spongiibacteraceae bacterium]
MIQIKRPQPTQLEAVLFDLDGTLIDTAPDFITVVNQLCRLKNHPEQSAEAIRATVSHGARALITLAFQLPEGDPAFEPLRQQLLALYQKNLAVQTQLFPGMNELLDWLELQAIPWGIVTNKPRLYAEPILVALSLAERCAVLVCPDDVTHTKPHPEPMLLACREIACNPQRTLYIGDHRRDIEAGLNAAMTTIAANYGYIDANDPSELWQADYAVNHASEIQPLLCELFAL